MSDQTKTGASAQAKGRNRRKRDAKYVNERRGPISVRLPTGVPEELGRMLAGAGLAHRTAEAVALVAEVYRRQVVFKVKEGSYIPLPLRPKPGCVGVETYLTRADVFRVKTAIASVLECNGKYKYPGGEHGPKGECYRYRIAKDWLTGRGGRPVTVVFDPDVNPTVHARLDEARAVKRARLEASLAELPEWFGTLYGYWQQVRFVHVPKKYQNSPILDAFNGNDPGHFIRCEQGRLHYSPTTIPRVMRQHIRFASHPCDEVGVADVSSAQPDELGWFVRQVEQGRLSPDQPVPPMPTGKEHRPAPPGTRHATHTDTHLLSGSSVIGVIDRVLMPSGEGWLDDYAAHCRAGVYYDRFADLLEAKRLRQLERGTAKASSRPWTKGRVKRTWMGGFYGPVEDQWGGCWRRKVVRAARQLYPEFTATWHKIASAMEHGQLPCLMQAYESYVMIDVVARRIVERYPGEPFLMVHDAVVCRVKFLPTVHRIITEAWEEVFGITPGVKMVPNPWDDSKEERGRNLRPLQAVVEVMCKRKERKAKRVGNQTVGDLE